MLFGSKKPEGKTLLLLDVENGSVGSALVYLESGERPKLFGEMRRNLRILPTRDSRSLLEEIRRGAHEAVTHAATIAARLRQHGAAHIGTPSRAAVYLGAPWGRPDLASGTPAFVGQMRDAIHDELHATGSVPPDFFTATGGVLGGVERALPYDDTYLLCIVGGEVTELLLVHKHAASGYATLPLGTHTLVRTMRAHGFSDAEAHSAMRLPTTAHQEPIRAAQTHFAEEFEAAVGPLLRFAPVRRMWVVSRGELGEWFARALSGSAGVANLFPQGGEVRVLRAAHITPHIAAHAHEPDLLLGLHALHAEVL